MWIQSVVWLGAVGVFLTVEAATTALVSLWFAVGALAGLAACLLGASLAVQLLAFAVVSALTLALMLPRVVARQKRQAERLPAGSMRTVGKYGVVLRDIDPQTVGRVRVDGLDWQARSNTVLHKADRCHVVGAEGFVLLVLPAEETEEDASPAAEPSANG